MKTSDALKLALQGVKKYVDDTIQENGFSGDYNDLNNRPCYDDRNYDVIECPEIFDGDISDRIVVDVVASAAISNEEDNVSVKGLAVVPRYVKISDIAPDLGIPMDNPETFMETVMDMMHKELIQIEVCYWDEGVEKTQKGRVTFDYDYIPEIGDYGFIDYYLKLTDMNNAPIAYFVYEEFTYESWGQSLSLTPGVWLIYGVEPNEDYTHSEAVFYGKTYTIKKYKDGELKELPSKYVSYKPGLRLDGQVIERYGEEITAGMYAEIFNAVENNIAIGTCSHAEGYATSAMGDYSHAEGSNTTANGDYSHAEGESTYANGDYSHAEGNNTSARGEAQHVQGKFNIYDNENKYAHIVGNGDWSARSNAHTLDWSGNAWFQGNVSIDGIPTDDNHLVTKKYIDDNINANSIVRPYEIFRVEETVFGKTGYIDVETMEPSVKYGLAEEYLDCNTFGFVIPTATTPYAIVCLAASFQVSDLMVTEKWEGDPSKGEEGLYIIVRGLNVDYKINIRHKESKDGVSIEIIRNTKYLDINNTKEFIPTGDYQPATKKYVDDVIPSIEGLATNFELNEMMLHQSVNFSELFEEKILINVNTKGNHTVYAPENNGDTTKALNRYMNIDQDLSSVNYGDYFMIDYREQNTPMTNLIFYKWGEFADKSRLISHVLEICVNNTRVQILTRLIKDMQSTAEGTLIDAPGKCTLQLTLGKTYNTPEIATIFDAMQVIIRFLKPHFLPLDNKSFEYTPTEDYQPATKKYADEAAGNVIAENINKPYTDFVELMSIDLQLDANRNVTNSDIFESVSLTDNGVNHSTSARFNIIKPDYFDLFLNSANRYRAKLYLDDVLLDGDGIIEGNIPTGVTQAVVFDDPATYPRLQFRWYRGKIFTNGDGTRIDSEGDIAIQLTYACSDTVANIWHPKKLTVKFEIQSTNELNITSLHTLKESRSGRTICRSDVDENVTAIAPGSLGLTGNSTDPVPPNSVIIGTNNTYIANDPSSVGSCSYLNVLGYNNVMDMLTFAQVIGSGNTIDSYYSGSGMYGVSVIGTNNKFVEPSGDRDSYLTMHGENLNANNCGAFFGANGTIPHSEIFAVCNGETAEDAPIFSINRNTGAVTSIGEPTVDNHLVNKKYVDGAISGLSDNLQGQIDDLFQNVSNGKELIASAITDKGVDASEEETFQSLSEKIGLIPSGPPGSNIIGYINEENDIYVSLTELESGTYTLKFEDYSGLLDDFDDIGNVEVE